MEKTYFNRIKFSTRRSLIFQLNETDQLPNNLFYIS